MGAHSTKAELAGERANDRYERRRLAIVAAATGLLNIHGVKGMRLADVASSLGLTTTSVTYYYRHKEDLAVACFEGGLAVFEAIAEVAGQAADTPERIRRFLQLHIEMRAAERAGRRAPIPIFSDIRSLKEPQHTRMMDTFIRMLDKVAALFDAPGYEWIGEAGRVARAHVLLEQMLWAVAWLPRYSRDDYARIEDRMADILLNGFAGPARAWAPQRIRQKPQVVNDQACREMFLGVATRLINDRGYRGASVTEIAAKLNLTKGSFYHHHDAKDDLVVACFKRSYGFMRGVQRQARDLDVNQWSKLSSAVAALVEHQLSPNGPLLRATALSAVPYNIRAEMVQMSERVSDHFAAIISDGVAEGSIRPVDAAIGAQMLTAMINAASDLELLLNASVDQAEVAALYAKPLLIGLLNR